MSGRIVALGLIGLSVSVALFALWHRSRDTARVREFWGADVASTIQNATHVERSLTSDDTRISGLQWTDISDAPGLIHLRATLVEDRYYRWPWVELSSLDFEWTEPEIRHLRFSTADSTVQIAIDGQRGLVIHQARNRVGQLITTSRDAIVRYLHELDSVAQAIQ